MDCHTMKFSEVLGELRSSKGGLSEDEAKKRLAIYGPNELKEEKRISAFALFARQFSSFLIILLLAAAVFSAFIENIVDSAVIIAIVILNAILGFHQEYKAEKALAALKRLTAPHAVVVRGGTHKEVPANALVPGDIILLEEGTRIPADIRLLEVANLKIDEASLTGESVPVEKTAEALGDVPLSERKNMAYAGTAVTYGRAAGVVVATAMGTEIGKIAHELQQQSEGVTPLQQRLNVFGRRLGVLIIALSVILIFAGFARGGGTVEMIKLGIALAVAAVPEGLPAIATITMAFGVQRMAKKNAVVRRLTAVEALGSTTFICADKTGTITRNEMTVREIYSNGRSFAVSGEGYRPEGRFMLGSKEINPKEERGLFLALSIGALCNNAGLQKDSASGEWQVTGDRTEAALLVAAAKAAPLDSYGGERLGEVPFSSERKRMSTLNRSAYGYRLQLNVKGAPEVVLSRCTKIFSGGRIAKLTPQEKHRILKANEKMASRALRVLCVAYRELGAQRAKADESMEKELTFAGLVGMLDPPREGVKEDLQLCKQAGIKVAMITGDHANTAKAVAEQVGLLEKGSHVLTGAELQQMQESELDDIVEQTAVYARVDPIQKVRIVDALKRKGHIVAMTGDGVNDAPALKRADIGIAMGIKGTDVAKEASEMVLSDDNFSTIVAAVKEGRTIYNNIRNFVFYLLSSNIGEVLLLSAALFIFGPQLLPLTAVQLLWINLVTDGLPATALGMDPAPPGVMHAKPRDPKESLLSKAALGEMLFVGILIAAGSALLFWLSLPNGTAYAQTTAFTAIVVFEMVRVYAVRMESGLSPFANKKLLAAVAFSIVLQLAVVYLPQVQALFGTAALAPQDWLAITGVAAALFAAMRLKRINMSRLYVTRTSTSPGPAPCIFPLR